MRTIVMIMMQLAGRAFADAGFELSKRQLFADAIRNKNGGKKRCIIFIFITDFNLLFVFLIAFIWCSILLCVTVAGSALRLPYLSYTAYPPCRLFLSDRLQVLQRLLLLQVLQWMLWWPSFVVDVEAVFDVVVVVAGFLALVVADAGVVCAWE